MFENLIEMNPRPGRDLLPPAGMRVLVQCDGFRCLAYRTRHGEWRRAFCNESLPRVLHVIPPAQIQRSFLISRLMAQGSPA